MFVLIQKVLSSVLIANDHKMYEILAHRSCPSIAQLVERWTVVVMVIHRSLVRIRLEG